MSLNGIAGYNGILQISLLADTFGLWLSDPGSMSVPKPGEVAGNGYGRLSLNFPVWAPWGPAQIINKEAWTWPVPVSVVYYITFWHSGYIGPGYTGSTYSGSPLSEGTYLGFGPIVSGKNAISTVGTDGTFAAPVHGLANNQTVRLAPALGIPLRPEFLSGPLYSITNQSINSFQLMDNTIQTITISGSPTGGNFTLSFGGQITGNIAYNASTSAVQTALTALSSVGAGNVTVTGSSGAWTVTFAGSLAIPGPLVLVNLGLTGGTLPAIAIAITGNLVVPSMPGYAYWQLVMPWVTIAPASVTLPIGTYALSAVGAGP